MTSLDCCGLFGPRETDGQGEMAGFLSDTTSYHAMVGQLYEELERKKVQLERLENVDSDESENLESLRWYGRKREGKNKQYFLSQGDGAEKLGHLSQLSAGTTVCRNVNNNQIDLRKMSSNTLYEIPLDDDDSNDDLETQGIKRMDKDEERRLSSSPRRSYASTWKGRRITINQPCVSTCPHVLQPGSSYPACVLRDKIHVTR